MVDAADRQSLIERLVELDGGDAARRARRRDRYSSYSDASLRRAVDNAEAAARDIAARGRLAAVWSDTGGEILVTAEEEAAERKAQDSAA